MSKLEITAAKVTFDEDEESQTLGFAESLDNPDRYLILQRSLDPDDQDLDLGFDKPHFQIGETISGYISNATYHLASSHLEINLPQDMASRLKGIDQILIRLPEGLNRDQLRNYLAGILD